MPEIINPFTGKPVGASSSNGYNTFNVEDNNKDVKFDPNRFDYSKNISEGSKLNDIINDESYREHNVYITPRFEKQNFDRQRANNQSGFAQFGNFLVQAGLNEIVLGTFRGFSDFADAVAHGFQRNTEHDYTNPVSSMIESWQDKIKENYKIYRRNEGETFDMGDSGWWWDNAVSVATTVALMLPSKGITGLGKFAIKKGSNLASSSKLFNKLSKEFKAAEGAIAKTEFGVKNLTNFNNRAAAITEAGATALFSRTMENYQEARESYRNIYDKYLNIIKSMSAEERRQFISNNPEYEGMNSEDIAKSIAAKGASDVFVYDYGMLLMDYMQFKALGSMFNNKVNVPATASNRLTQKSLLKRFANPKESAPLEFSFGDKMKEHLSYAITHPYKSILALQVGEGFEEGYQGIMQQLGEQKAEKIINPAYKYKTLGDYLTDSSIYEQAFWGMVGGIVFGAAHSGIRKGAELYDERKIKQQHEEGKISDEEFERLTYTLEKQRNLDINSRFDLTSMMINNIDKIDKGLNPFKIKRDANGKEIYTTNENGEQEYEYEPISKEAAAELKSEIIADWATNLAINASDAGNIESLIDMANSKEFESYFTANNQGNLFKNAINQQSVVETINKASNLYTKAINNIIYSGNIDNEFAARLAAKDIVSEQMQLEKLRADLSYYNNAIAENDNNNVVSQNYRRANMHRLTKKEITELEEYLAKLADAKRRGLIDERLYNALKEKTRLEEKMLLRKYGGINNEINLEGLDDSQADINNYIQELNNYEQKYQRMFADYDASNANITPNSYLKGLIDTANKLEIAIDAREKSLPYSNKDYIDRYNSAQDRINAHNENKRKQLYNGIKSYIKNNIDYETAVNNILSGKVNNKDIIDALHMLKEDESNKNKSEREILDGIKAELEREQRNMEAKSRNVTVEGKPLNEQAANEAAENMRRAQVPSPVEGTSGSNPNTNTGRNTAIPPSTGGQIELAPDSIRIFESGEKVKILSTTNGNISYQFVDNEGNVINDEIFEDDSMTFFDKLKSENELDPDLAEDSNDSENLDELENESSITVSENEFKKVHTEVQTIGIYIPIVKKALYSLNGSNVDISDASAVEEAIRADIIRQEGLSDYTDFYSGDEFSSSAIDRLVNLAVAKATNNVTEEDATNFIFGDVVMSAATGTVNVIIDENEATKRMYNFLTNYANKRGCSVVKGKTVIDVRELVKYFYENDPDNMNFVLNNIAAYWNNGISDRINNEFTFVGIRNFNMYNYKEFANKYKAKNSDDFIEEIRFHKPTGVNGPEIQNLIDSVMNSGTKVKIGYPRYEVKGGIPVLEDGELQYIDKEKRKNALVLYIGNGKTYREIGYIGTVDVDETGGLHLRNQYSGISYNIRKIGTSYTSNMDEFYFNLIKVLNGATDLTFNESYNQSLSIEQYKELADIISEYRIRMINGEQNNRIAEGSSVTFAEAFSDALKNNSIIKSLYGEKLVHHYVNSDDPRLIKYDVNGKKYYDYGNQELWRFDRIGEEIAKIVFYNSNDNNSASDVASDIESYINWIGKKYAEYEKTKLLEDGIKDGLDLEDNEKFLTSIVQKTGKVVYTSKNEDGTSYVLRDIADSQLNFPRVNPKTFYINADGKVMTEDGKVYEHPNGMDIRKGSMGFVIGFDGDRPLLSHFAKMRPIKGSVFENIVKKELNDIIDGFKNGSIDFDTVAARLEGLFGRTVNVDGELVHENIFSGLEVQKTDRQIGLKNRFDQKEYVLVFNRYEKDSTVPKPNVNIGYYSKKRDENPNMKFKEAFFNIDEAIRESALNYLVNKVTFNRTDFMIKHANKFNANHENRNPYSHIYKEKGKLVIQFDGFPKMVYNNFVDFAIKNNIAYTAQTVDNQGNLYSSGVNFNNMSVNIKDIGSIKTFHDLFHDVKNSNGEVEINVNDLLGFYENNSLNALINNLRNEGIELFPNKLLFVNANNEEEFIYSPRTDEIYIYKKGYDEIKGNFEALKRLLIHESVHKQITNYINESGVREKFLNKKRVNELLDLYNTSKDEITKLYDNETNEAKKNLYDSILKNIYNVLDKRLAEGKITNEVLAEEFLVESMSQQGLTRVLNNIKYDFEESNTKDTILSKIFEFICKLFGININKNTILAKEFEILKDVNIDENSVMPAEESNTNETAEEETDENQEDNDLSDIFGETTITENEVVDDENIPDFDNIPDLGSATGTVEYNEELDNMLNFDRGMTIEEIISNNGNYSIIGSMQVDNMDDFINSFNDEYKVSIADMVRNNDISYLCK